MSEETLLVVLAVAVAVLGTTAAVHHWAITTMARILREHLERENQALGQHLENLTKPCGRGEARRRWRK